MEEGSCLRVELTSTLISRLVLQENAAKGENGPAIYTKIHVKADTNPKDIE